MQALQLATCKWLCGRRWRLSREFLVNKTRREIHSGLMFHLESGDRALDCALLFGVGTTMSLDAS